MSGRTAQTALIATVFALAVALVFVSAFVRHVNAGLGDIDTTAQYGAIGGVDTPADHAPQWAVGAHRVLASSLGLAVIALVATAAWRRRPQDWWGIGALGAITLGLAVLGLRSATLHEPSVVVANAAGGVALVALSARLLCPRVNLCRALPGPRSGLRLGAAVLVGLLSLQLVAGFLLSANFGGLACPVWGGCDRPWALWEELLAAWGTLEIDAAGMVLRGDNMGGLHTAHRALGFATAAGAMILGAAGWRSGLKFWGSVLIGLAAATVASGLLSVVTALDLRAVFGHYVLALAMAVWIIPFWRPVFAEDGHGG